MAEKNYRVLWIIVGLLSALVFTGGIITVIWGLLKTTTISGKADAIGSAGIVVGGVLVIFFGFTLLSKAIARL